jgi:hypothetical protein
MFLKEVPYAPYPLRMSIIIDKFLRFLMLLHFCFFVILHHPHTYAILCKLLINLGATNNSYYDNGIRS